MRKSLILAAACAALTLSSTAQAETGDILIKARGTFSLRSGADAVTGTANSSVVSATAGNAFGAEAAMDFFLTSNILMEFAFSGAPYDVKDAATGKNLVSAGMITPTVSLLYYPLPAGRFRPYFGGGVTYANFYSEKSGELLANAQHIPIKVALKSNLAPVGQIGADIAVSDQLYVNIDAKYLLAKSKLTVTPSAPVPGFNIPSANQNLNSFTLGAGVGFKF